MEVTVTLAFLSAAFFSLFKFIEYRFIEKDKEMKALKYFARDIILVFTAVFVSAFISFNMHRTMNELFNVITETKIIHPSTTQIFTDAPGF